MKKEFKLSEKRKELFKVIESLEFCEFDEVELRIDKIEQIKSLIKSQDKEFIELLKEELLERFNIDEGDLGFIEDLK